MKVIQDLKRLIAKLAG